MCNLDCLFSSAFNKFLINCFWEAKLLQIDVEGFFVLFSFSYWEGINGSTEQLESIQLLKVFNWCIILQLLGAEEK